MSNDREQEIVQRIADQSDDPSQAIKALMDQASEDRELFDYLTSDYLSRACYDAVWGVIHRIRKSAWAPPNYAPSGNGHRIKSHARRLMDDFWLPHGPRLRDATKDDLLSAMDFYSKQAENMAQKARWLEKLAEVVGDRKVSEVLSNDDVEALRRDHQEAA